MKQPHKFLLEDEVFTLFFFVLVTFRGRAATTSQIAFSKEIGLSIFDYLLKQTEMILL